VSDGLALAGYEVVRVDLVHQKRYPFEFRQADALAYPLDGFDLICACPTCQAYTSARHIRGREHPRLIEAVRDRLASSGIPCIIENVVGAPLINPVMLRGGMFGLKVWRHRLFEASFPVSQPAHPAHNGSRPKTGRPRGAQHRVARRPDPAAGPGRRPAEAPGLLDDQDTQPEVRRGQRGRQAGRAAARHHDVELCRLGFHTRTRYSFAPPRESRAPSESDGPCM
jgi:hypothetical protein